MCVKKVKNSGFLNLNPFILIHLFTKMNYTCMKFLLVIKKSHRKTVSEKITEIKPLADL